MPISFSIPKPRSYEIEQKTPVSYRVRKVLKKELESIALESKRSVSELIVDALVQALDTIDWPAEFRPPNYPGSALVMLSLRLPVSVKAGVDRITENAPGGNTAFVQYVLDAFIHQCRSRSSSPYYRLTGRS